MLHKKILELFNFKNSSPYFLTIDLGSETIKVLLNEIILEDNEEKIRVKNIYKEYLSSEVSHSGTLIDPLKVRETLESIHNQIHKEYKGFSLNKAVINLSGNNARSIMTTIQIDRPFHKAISVEESHEIMQKVFDNAYQELSKIIKDESGRENLELELLDYMPIYLNCDNREVIDLIGEEGNDIQVCFSVFFGFSSVMEEYRKILKNIGITETSFISSNQAILKSLKKTKKDKIDCVILDIGGNSTEAIICFGGGVFLNKILDMGGSDLTAELSSKLKLSFLNAEKLKRLYTFNKLNSKESAIVQKILLFNLSNWLVGLEELFDDFDTVKVFPSDFYVIGGSSELPDITELLFEEPWTKSIPFKSLPEFKKIDLTSLKKLDKAQIARPNEDLIPILVSIEYLNIKNKDERN